MKRKEEIEIIILYIKNDLKRIYDGYPALVEDKIIEYGVLIKKYQDELNSIKE